MQNIANTRGWLTSGGGHEKNGNCQDLPISSLGK
jgi:hypothetical protein